MRSLKRAWWRWGALYGIGFVILFIIGGVVQGSTPSFDAPVEDIREYWVEDGQQYLIGSYTLVLTFVLLWLPFISTLWSLLGYASAASEVWARVGFAGGLAALFFGSTASIFWGTLAWGNVAEQVSDDDLRLLMFLDVYAFTALEGIAFGITLLGFSVAILLSRSFWTWLGWFGVVIGALALVSALSILSDDPEDSAFGFLGFIALIGLALWIVATAVGMWMRGTPPESRRFVSEA